MNEVPGAAVGVEGPTTKLLDWTGVADTPVKARTNPKMAAVNCMVVIVGWSLDWKRMSVTVGLEGIDGWMAVDVGDGLELRTTWKTII